MKTLQFTGRGDDTFGEYGVTWDDYDNCASETPIKWLIETREGSLIVVGSYNYTDNGTWVIGVTMTDEDGVIPNWATRVKNGNCGYSPMLEIDVPDDFSLTCLNRVKEK